MIPDRAITTTATPATLRQVPGQPLARYVFVLSLGVVFRWAINSSAADDGFAAIVPLTGGFQGAWLRVRPLATGTGTPALLADAPQHINIGLGAWFTASSFTADRTVTIDATNAQVGDELEVTNPSAHIVTLAGGLGTIKTCPAGSFCIAYFDGTNWLHRRSALLLP